MKAPISLRSRERLRNVLTTMPKKLSHISQATEPPEETRILFQLSARLEFNARKTSLCTFLSLNSSQREHRTGTSPPTPSVNVWSTFGSCFKAKQGKVSSRSGNRNANRPSPDLDLPNLSSFQLHARSNQSSRCARGMHGAEYRMTDN